MDIIIVNKNLAQAQKIQQRFIDRFGDSATIETLEGALYALTIFERRQPTLIISGEHVGDMSGTSFYELVREDTSLNSVPFILLDTKALHSPFIKDTDAVLTSSVEPVELVRAAFEVLIKSGARADDRDDRRNKKFKTPTQSSVKATGTFEALTLFDLVISLSQNKQSGQLTVHVHNQVTTLSFREGDLLGAQANHLSGEDAILYIFKAASEDSAATFFFETDETPLTIKKPIRRPINKLLLEVAVALDEQRFQSQRLTAKG